MGTTLHRLLSRVCGTQLYRDAWDLATARSAGQSQGPIGALESRTRIDPADKIKIR